MPVRIKNSPDGEQICSENILTKDKVCADAKSILHVMMLGQF